MSTVRKMKKRWNLRKSIMVDIGDGLKIPVRTLSVSEESRISLEMPTKIPKKITKPTEAQKREFMDSDPNYSDKTYIAVSTYDPEAPEYKTAKTKMNSFEPFLESLKYIDFEAKVRDEEGNEVPFWQEIGLLSPSNWWEICETFDEMGFSEVHAEKIIMASKKLKGDSLFQRLYRIQNIVDIDYITLISAIERLLEDKTLADKSPIYEQIQKIMENEIDEPGEAQDTESETSHK